MKMRSDFFLITKLRCLTVPAAAMCMLGFAPIKEMLNANVCVSLGTDGAPSNNRMSIIDEMYLASLINKGREVFSKGTTDPTALPAESILVGVGHLFVPSVYRIKHDNNGA